MRRYTSVLLSIPLLIAGCGDSEEKPKTAVRTEAESVLGGDVELDRPVRITTPKQGAGLRTGPITVKGTGTPDAFVRVSAGCRDAGCSRLAVVGSDGRFDAQLSLPAAGRPTITAKYDQPGRYRPAQVKISLRAPPGGGDAKRERAEDVPDSDDSLGYSYGEITPSDNGTTPRNQQLLMVGDSLAVGTRPHLAGALPGWQVSTNAETGRPLAAGMGVIRSASIPAGSVLGVSLFTNDSPTGVTALNSAVRESAAKVGAGGCVIWATIVRPPVSGVSYDKANAKLRALDGAEIGGARVRIVDWAAAVAESPEWLAGDGVHATPAGYRARAGLYADAARSC